MAPALTTKLGDDGQGMESNMTYVDIEAPSSLPLTRPAAGIRPTVRQRRLQRLAEILDNHDDMVPLLSRLEYAPWQERPYLRADRSPLSIAFEDEGFRREGLSGDRLGDIVGFFELSDAEAHHLLCYCHYASSVTSKMVAERARELAQKKTLGQRFQGLWIRMFGHAA
jgi:hypothetical protein